MTLPTLLDPAWCPRLVLTLGHVLWQAAAIALLAAVVAWLLRRATAQSRYAVLLAALLLMAACPVVTFCLLSVPAEVPAPMPAEFPAPAGQPEAPAPTSPVAAATEEVLLVSEEAPPPSETPEPITGAEEVVHRHRGPEEVAGVDWDRWKELAPHLTVAYLLGVAVMVTRLLVGLRGGARLRRESKPVGDPRLLAVLGQRAKQLGVRLAPAVAYCRQIAAPTVVGVLRPMVLLPLALASGLTPGHLDAILTHELAHIRRYDHLANLLQRVIEAVLFFHPAVWWVSRRIRAEREHCCDDMVVAACGEPLHYAESLVRVAEMSRRAPTPVGVAASGDRPSQLRARIGRLLGGAQLSPVRLTRVGAAVLTTALVLGIASLVLIQTHAGPPPEAEADEATFDHFLYLRHDVVDGGAKTDTLVLVKVTPDGFEQRELFTQRNLHIGWKPLNVVDGKLYALKIGRLLSIDVATGQAESLFPRIESHACVADRLYALVHDRGRGPVLRVFDLRTRAYRDVCRVEVAGWRGPPIAVSPDRKRVAFFRAQGDIAPATTFRLNVVDLEAGAVRPVGEVVHSWAWITGGGHVADGPPFVWLDARTILFLRDVPARDADPRSSLFVMGSAEANMRATTVDVETGTMRDLLALPRWRRRMGEPVLSPPGDDGCPRVLLGHLGQYRVELEAGRLVEDDRVRGAYRWVRGREPEQVYHGAVRLAEFQRMPEVAVSPDGQRIVWLTGRRLPSEVQYHDARGKGVRRVAKGWFAEGLLWAAAGEVGPAEAPEAAAGWTAFTPQPYPEPRGPREADQRPPAADILTLTLSTDKDRYWRHEPVKLTVTLTNKTDQKVTFPRPPEHGNFFGLRMRSPRSSAMIDEFERTREVFPADPVVIKPGGSFQCTRTLEPWDLGGHKVEGLIRRVSPQWRGVVRAEPITFLVEQSPEEARLVKAKFDRLLAISRREFEADPATCHWGRFLALGPAAVPHLVATLEASDDPRFRRRLGAALERLANDDALPYFDKLLQGDMKADGPMVLDSLHGMMRRPECRDAALLLLLAALEHANPETRRGAAERLREVHDPQVAAGFEVAVDDNDHRTAAIAARYLAAYEGLDLADWLARAAAKPTKARYLAARSTVADLEQTWQVRMGNLPAARWEDAAQAPDGFKLFGKVLRAWEQWARQNPRFAERFFDPDRQHWPKADPKPKAPRAAAARGDPAYDHFLYLRHNEKDGRAVTDTLVHAKVTPEGFQLRDLYTSRNLSVGWKPLCVVGGGIYAIKIQSLLCIDLATGHAENLCSTLASHTYRGGRLYALVHREGGATLRAFDFRTKAYRDITRAPAEWDHLPMSVSPDHKRLVLLKPEGPRSAGHVDPTPHSLTVVDLATGASQRLPCTLREGVGALSTRGSPDGPPLVWLDPQTILFVPDPVHGRAPRGASESIKTINVATGEMNDVVPLPRGPLRGFPGRGPGVWSLPEGGMPRLLLPGLGQYRIDLKARKLLEDDSVGGKYRLRHGAKGRRLFYQEEPLSPVGRITFAVSPDGRRVIWTSGWPAREVRYHDSEDGAVQTVARGSQAGGLLWFGERDLKPSSAAGAPAGWTPFARRPRPETRPPRPDTRKRITDYLTFTLHTDKNTYRLHEPVRVTVEVRNTSEIDVQVLRPTLFDGRIVSLGLEYPGGARLLSGIGAYLPKAQKVSLKPGAAITVTDTLEVARVGDHRIEGELKRFSPAGAWRGRLKAPPVRFRVVASPDAEQLFKAKFHRLLAKFTREFDTNPGWDGMNRTLQRDMAGMGPDAAAYIVEAVRGAKDARFRRMLYRPLVSVASPDALPFFKECLTRGAPAEVGMACGGLYELYCRGRAAEEALDALLSHLTHDKADVRRAVTECLVRIHDRRVEEGFEAALGDTDDKVRTQAARYLAAYEGLDLADWLAQAAAKPTKARYLAAHSIIPQLEQTWHLKMGDLPAAPWEDAAQAPDGLRLFGKVLRAWEQWARQNPRSSARFFDPDRQHWPRTRPAGGAAPVPAPPPEEDGR